MTSAVTKAMIESYALMVMVMGTFFVYFCGMVWAFCNPKLSAAEEDVAVDTDTAAEAAAPQQRCWACDQIAMETIRFNDGAHPAASPSIGDWIARSTYIHFWGGSDSFLMSDNAGFLSEDSSQQSVMWIQ